MSAPRLVSFEGSLEVSNFKTMDYLLERQLPVQINKEEKKIELRNEMKEQKNKKDKYCYLS